MKTKESSFITIRNAIIAGVSSGIILLFIPAIRNILWDILKWLWSIVVSIWDFLASSQSLPGWIIVIISLLALIETIRIIIAFVNSSKDLEYKSYVEDYINNTKWRWDWSGRHVVNLWCYCPRCDATLVYDDSSKHDFYAPVVKTILICENCNRTTVTEITGGDRNYALGAVTREIERRVRTGEYKKSF